jgi:YesN/AraC family two-component response regulator
MQQLTKGKYYGSHKKITENNGLIISDTVYTHPKVDWHYHENIYFTFLINGKLFEVNKKESYECLPGTLLFHNWQDAHYNIKPPGYARGFHIEIEKKWLDSFYENASEISGSFKIENPSIKTMIRKIFIEFRCSDKEAKISAEENLLNIFSELRNNFHSTDKAKPLWVNKVREILHNDFHENISLKYLAQTLGLHPVYLSRSFPVYFKSTIGEYMRKIKIEKSMKLLSQVNLSLSEISLLSGFADQSHFNRCFKEAYHITPNQYRTFII